MLDLGAIEARERRTTDGPWHHGGPYPGGSLLILDDDGEPVASVACAASLDPDRARRDAEAVADFIAQAREDIPALVAEVRRLRAEMRDAEVRAATEMQRAIAADLRTYETLTGAGAASVALAFSPAALSALASKVAT